ncbi:DUF4118 domain-containing protein [Kribbella shirazensis]|uniref:Histidine kinase n=1 Tax=Kribbella shirazensis TaxID=1105143 RepID=A0A7X6A2P7_9ACTN|nr:DUF4118 domain-containing protein [Kribbella shirazensis]NIK59165.1 hypothetical protein [Kribbella shirazensis]
MLFSIWPPQAAPSEPWFRRHPRVALTVAGVTFAAILSLRMLVGDPMDAYSMLYALPVALVAITCGLRSGLAAGLLAVGLIVVWVIARDVPLSPMGWASRVVPLLLLGPLLGDASDRLRRADAERRRLEAAALLQREAIEINDSLVQGMVAAKWSLEATNLEGGLRILDDTIGQAQSLVSGLIRSAGHGTQAAPGRGQENERTSDRVRPG